MKTFFTTIIAFFLLATVPAQNNIKPASLGIHYSLTDFETAAKIKVTSLRDVLKNNQWSLPGQMMTGIGVDFLKGITNHIDFAASFNYTKGINTYNLPSTNINSYSLFTLETLLNIKFISDKHYVRPFLIAGAGLYDQNGTGMFAPLGIGFQFNIFNAAILNVQAQYNMAFKSADNSNLFYQIGFATALTKKKSPTTKIEIKSEKKELMPEPKPVVIAEVKKVSKNIVVSVNDESTLLPIPFVEVKLASGDSIVFTSITDSSGKVFFKAVKKGNYIATGFLNNINTSTISLSKENFNIGDDQIKLSLTHNDPRFTLTGYAADKTAGKAVGNATITITNTSQNSSKSTISNGIDGQFHIQLESNSDFIISGKKANYISNIENISTKGLNRSTTLYVKLELRIEEAKSGKTIVLNKIYFEKGSTNLNTTASGDLNKLVQFLKDNPTIKLEISGHTDNIGGLILNNTLSLSRAKSVTDYLIKNGIGKNRLFAKGYGPLQPIASNATAEGKAKNRRVEMKVIQ